MAPRVTEIYGFLTGSGPTYPDVRIASDNHWFWRSNGRLGWSWHVGEGSVLAVFITPGDDGRVMEFGVYEDPTEMTFFPRHVPWVFV